MEKKKIHINAQLPCSLAVSHIECFLEGLRAGDIVIEQGDERIVLHPQATVTLDVEAKSKKHKQRLTINLEWCTPHACKKHERQHGKKYHPHHEGHPPHPPHHEGHQPPPPPNEDAPEILHSHEHTHGDDDHVVRHTHQHGHTPDHDHHPAAPETHYMHDKHGFHSHYHCHGDSEHKLCHTHEHTDGHHDGHQHTGCCEDVEHTPHKGCCAEHNYGSGLSKGHEKHEHGHKGCCEGKTHDPHKGCCSTHEHDQGHPSHEDPHHGHRAKGKHGKKK
ncbi:MAG: amphi-Trp domain-containing protein [Desulfovibrionales bacterium]|nr:amphi-Trp domain-containing protein [Desulfovibrionales bacterium]